MRLNLCTRCGHEAVEETSVPFIVEHGEKKKTIQDVRMRCPACENLSYQGDQISQHEKAVAAAIREMDGLLSPQDLSRIRLKYRFKQSEMEQMLSTGPKTWTRWERGKVPHSKAADKLIRVMAENPEVARRLMEQAGVSNSEAVEVFDQIERDANIIARAALKAQVGEGYMRGDFFVEQFYDHALNEIRAAREKVIGLEVAA